MQYMSYTSLSFVTYQNNLLKPVYSEEKSTIEFKHDLDHVLYTLLSRQ